jgi:hypothetical protein
MKLPHLLTACWPLAGRLLASCWPDHSAEISDQIELTQIVRIGWSGFEGGKKNATDPDNFHHV